MALTKQVRINPAGKIVKSDRKVCVMKDDGDGVADSVEWVYVGAADREYIIDFSPYLNRSPFLGGRATEKFVVPRKGIVYRVDPDKAPGVYKYDVCDSKGGVIDDPDVIIE